MGRRSVAGDGAGVFLFRVPVGFAADVFTGAAVLAIDGLTHERKERGDFSGVGVEAFELVELGDHGGGVLEEEAIGGAEGFNLDVGEAAALKAIAVDIADGGGVSVENHVRRDIVGDGGHAADEGVPPDADEMVRGDGAGEHDPVFDEDVSGEENVVGDDATGADEAVVGDVGADHEEVVAADARVAAAVLGADMDGAGFAELVMVADDEAAGSAAVFEVLRDAADDGVGEELVGLADGGVAFDGCMVLEDAAAGDLDVGAHIGEGADDDVFSEPGAGFDKGERMNLGHGLHLQGTAAADHGFPRSLLTSMNLMIASAAIWSPT